MTFLAIWRVGRAAIFLRTKDSIRCRNSADPLYLQHTPLASRGMIPLRSSHAVTATTIICGSNLVLLSEFINRNSSVVCQASLRLLLPEIQVKDRLLTFLDNNEHAAVSISLRPSYDGVSANRQRYDLGNLIIRGTSVFNVFEEFSVDRVDGVRAVWKVPRVAILEFIGGRIDLEITLW